MIDIRRPDGTNWFVDKGIIQKILAEQNERLGFVPDTAATPEKVREMMLALGIRPEDNSSPAELLPQGTRNRYLWRCCSGMQVH
ncbi:MAG: hypothetical protein NVSMB52_17100 [Chloroflexota bacterium]